MTRKSPGGGDSKDGGVDEKHISQGGVNKYDGDSAESQGG